MKKGLHHHFLIGKSNLLRVKEKKKTRSASCMVGSELVQILVTVKQEEGEKGFQIGHLLIHMGRVFPFIKREADFSRRVERQEYPLRNRSESKPGESGMAIPTSKKKTTLSVLLSVRCREKKKGRGVRGNRVERDLEALPP